MQRAFAIALLAVSGIASGNTIRQALGSVEPTVNIKDGAVQGCGHRYMLVEMQADSQGGRFVIDASVSIDSSGLGLLKAGLLKFKSDESRSVQPIESFWIKGQELKVVEVQASAGFLPSVEPKGYLLAGSTLKSAGELLGLFAEGKRSLMVGVRLKGASIDHVLRSELELKPDDLKGFIDCLNGLKLQIQDAR